MTFGATYVTTFYVGPRVARFTEEEREAHRDVAVCKARGGSPLLQGARSPGRWDPACSCGWRNSANEGRREAEQAHRDHRRGAALEARWLAAGQLIYRVLVVHDVPGALQPIREWRAIATEAEAWRLAANERGMVRAVVQRSVDGKRWKKRSRPREVQHA